LSSAAVVELDHRRSGRDPAVARDALPVPGWRAGERERLCDRRQRAQCDASLSGGPVRICQFPSACIIPP
jgi:hypothetical protein